MLNIRFAEKEDANTIVFLIRSLADYQKMSDEVVVTKEHIEKWMFDEKKAEAIIASEDGKDIGFALFFYSFSTFLGKPGIHLEDLFVIPEYRGKGCGKALLNRVKEITIERNCERLEWSCLNWNAPSLEFYRSYGAERLDEWITFRLTFGDSFNPKTQ